MKNICKVFMVAVLAITTTVAARAQQVNTLYFLENAPMRHTLNPAFQPVSQGYINFTPLGWTTFGIGNNSLTMSDVLYVDPTTGKTITPLHPNGDKNAFLKIMRNMTMVDGDFTLGILNMGFRIKENGFLTIGINERFDVGTTMPKSMFQFMLGGGMTHKDGTINSFNLTGLGIGSTVYSELGVGYSHKINDHWTVGGKLKFLAGTLNLNMNSKALNIDANIDRWRLRGNMDLNIAGPIDFAKLPALEGRSIMDVIDEIQNGDASGKKIDWQKDVLGIQDINKDWPKLITPSGYGAAIDFGFTYKPIENLQVSAAINDLGFIYWTKAQKFNCSVDTAFTGIGEIDYNDPAFHDEQGNFSGQMVLDSAVNRLKGIANSIKLQRSGSGYAKMVSAKLNVGLDANFWENRVGVGILSATRLYNARLYEEITLGLSFRPFNWLNIAATYSLMNNGKYSNIGAGLSIMPYDGINMTLAMDYIPTSYAGIDVNGTTKYLIPDKAKMLNVALGFSICWGSNRRDKDKDGVWDKIDMCPGTPRGVVVDENGCPVDEDHDGVPDYLDKCPGSPAEAVGFVDSVGCPLDSDGDGVPDYRDWCQNTPAEARGMVDSIGCVLDSDGDGVPDYADLCPGTPAEAKGMVNINGCPIDTDGDGVPDYMDACPDTPVEAKGKVDANGCPSDSDGDGIPDYLDECPSTPEAAKSSVDDKGCAKDSDGDGVPDYIDVCPNTPATAKGLVNPSGCPIDSDGDGVFDYEDECPQVAGVKANKGCPEMKREVRRLLQRAMQGIEFETGKATIKRKSYPILDQVAAIFTENPNYIVEIQGHTDNTGKPEMNKKLSQQRAESVMKYMVERGIASERLSAVGYGDEKPIADNKTAAGRQKNRRVEFKISFEEVHVESVLDHAEQAPATPATPATPTAE